MNFLGQDTIKDALMLASQLSTVLGFVYGLLWLERYRKQKVLEHYTDNARKGLDEIVMLEEMLDTLFADSHEDVAVILHKSLPNTLRELYKALLLLKDLPGISGQVKLFEKLSDVVINADTTPDVTLTNISQIYVPYGGYKQASKELKTRLLDIYVLRR